jgi:hypothetical protein
MGTNSDGVLKQTVSPQFKPSKSTNTINKDVSAKLMMAMFTTNSFTAFVVSESSLP